MTKIDNYFHESDKPILVVGVAPLWELEYTGISNVVFEISKRFISDLDSPFDIKFSVFNKIVDKAVIQECLNNRSGSHLQAAFNANESIADVFVDENGCIGGRRTFGLFLHTKPHRRVFMKDSHLYYDFSFLLTQECHTPDTVAFHLDGLVEQVKSTDLFFCISESTASDLRWLFNVPDEKVVVALLGNNVNVDMANKARGLIGDREVEPYFLMLGTIEPRKNIALIFEWLKKNPNFLKNFRFIFAGREGWGPSFSDYIKKYELSEFVVSNRIVHLGYINEAVKATLIVGAQAIFYPSIFEGFGLPVLEAMECGAIVIASCSTSIPEVLGDTGYYFDPYSVESLDMAFSEFLSDQQTGRLDHTRKMAKERASNFSYDSTYLVISDSLRSNFLGVSSPPLPNSDADDLTVTVEHFETPFALNDDAASKSLLLESKLNRNLSRSPKYDKNRVRKRKKR